MIHRPPEMGAFQFVVVAALRAAQLTRGCTPRITESHTVAATAQREVSEGKIAPLDAQQDAPSSTGDIDVT